MKNLVIRILFILSICCADVSLKAQPNPSGGGGGSPVGGAAPVGSGIICLVCLGVSYGLFKVHKKKT